MAHLVCTDHSRRVYVPNDAPVRHRNDWTECHSLFVVIGGITWAAVDVGVSAGWYGDVPDA